MSINLAEKEEIYKKRQYPLLYLVKEEYKVERKGNIAYSDTRVFPILLVVILFLCLGIVFNIGLRIQNINYQKKIYEISEMISTEEERADRLLLKVSKLKSPSRIIDIAENDLGMEISDELSVVEISNDGLANSEKIYDYISKDSPALVKEYDGFLGTIYYIQDIIMVVSEGVLTFFIPKL